VSLEFYTNEEIIRAAHRRLAQGPWDYLSGGTESETSLRRNRLAFDRLALRPRVLVDVSTVDRSTTPPHEMSAWVNLPGNRLV
jgi:glycolate oxidase